MCVHACLCVGVCTWVQVFWRLEKDGIPRIRSYKAICEPPSEDARNWILVLWKNNKRLNCWDISPAPHLLLFVCLFCISIFQPGFCGLNLVSQKHFTYWVIFPALEARVFSKAILEGKIKAEWKSRPFNPIPLVFPSDHPFSSCEYPESTAHHLSRFQ